jgi:hypothetical protein
VKYSDAGGYVLLVAAALITLLIASWRAGRSLLREIWVRIGIFRWIFILIAIAVVVGITRQYPER